MATRRRRLRAGDDIKELTLRGIILGALITVVFTAANVYLGLKIGITFATSIPAAVISMAVLKAFRDSTIQENNIVQTIASAAGTLSAIIFVLPGLIMVGWWTGFPYWLSVAVIGIGGILGVMYSVPLRRALVTGTDLPYPEGVAAAEVLKVGSGRRRRRGEPARPGADRRIDASSSALYFLLAKTRLLTDTAGASRSRSAPAASAISASLSMALIGVGHLVGVAVGVAMVVGMLITWVFIVPHWTQDAGLSPPGRRRPRDAGQRGVQAEGADGRRRHDRRRRDLDAAQDHRPDRRGHPLGAGRQSRAQGRPRRRACR